VDFDELTAMASEQRSSGPALNEMTPGAISSGLMPTTSPSMSYVRPSRNDWDLLFQPMFNELLNLPPSVVNQAPETIAPIVEVIPPVNADSTDLPSSTTVEQDAPSTSNSPTPTETQSSVIPQNVRDDHLDINKSVDPTSHTQKPGRKIVTGHSFSPNKSSAVHEKTNTPRSCLRWIPTARIFHSAGLKWVPTGKTFTSSTTKVNCEPPNGSNDYITNPYKCNQTFNVSAGTLNLSAGTFCNSEKERLRVHLKKDLLFQPMFDELLNPPPSVVNQVPEAIAPIAE
nr:hypothetical protein [Tanacetum cinerariifolium]